MDINFRRWGVFNAAGLGGFVVQICAIALLTRHLGWPVFAATVVALELRRYWRYQWAKTGSLAANLAITAVLIQIGLPAEVANTAAVLVCAIPNYLVSEHLVFTD